MATIINMPRLSDTMTEGTVASWLKKVGDKVSEGDILAEIETDKATIEFEAFDEGTLLYIGIQAGETAPIDTLLAIIGKEGEDISALIAGKAAPAPAKEEAPAATEEVVESKKEETAAPVAVAAAALPAGVIVVTMPRLSDTMTEGTVATWLKKAGDKVVEGDMLAEIETDKATMEFESFNEGTLLYIGIQEGESAPIDSLLAIIGPEGTDITGIASGYTAGGSAPAAVATEEAKAAPAAQTTPVVQEAPADGQRVLASPLAKKIASEKGIQLTQVKGSGENGRITKSDVENFTPASSPKVTESKPQEVTPARSEVAPTPKPYVPAGQVATEEIKNSQMRKSLRNVWQNLYSLIHITIW